MWIDPIIEEIRQAGDEYAAKFNYDLAAMFRDLKDRQQKEGRRVVSFSPKPYVYLPPSKLLKT